MILKVKALTDPHTEDDNLVWVLAGRTQLGDDVVAIDGWPHDQAGRGQEATRLLGFALFNHAKGNQEATEALMRKAYKALTGKEWDG